MPQSLLIAADPTAAPPGWLQFLPLVAMGLIVWFLIMRPQMKRQKEHQTKVQGLKKNDQVVTAGGLVGRVIRVDDDYAEIELAQGMRVKAVRQTIADVIQPGGKPAND